MNSDHVMKNVHDELQRRFRIAGRGAVSRVQEQLHLGAGYFRDLRRPGRRRFDLRVLLEALGALQVDAAEFFSSVLGTADPIQTFKAEAAYLRRRQKRTPRILELLEERTGSENEHLDLSALAAEFRDQPRQVRQRAMAWVRRIHPDQLAQLLAIYGSACRVSVQLEVAQIVLAEALEMAEESKDLTSQAEILMRCSYVLAARLNYKGAAELVEKSVLLYTRARNSLGIGKALLDLANWNVAMENQQEGLELYRAALEHLPESSANLEARANRYSCFCNIGRLHMSEGNLGKARDYIRQAQEVSEGLDASLQGKAMWLEAQIYRREDRLDHAERLYREAIGVFQDRSPLDVAVLSVELTRVQFLQHKIQQAYATAKTMTTLLFPLESNPIAAAAITEMIRCALEGRGLTLQLIDEVSRKLNPDQKEAVASS